MTVFASTTSAHEHSERVNQQTPTAANAAQNSAEAATQAALERVANDTHNIVLSHVDWALTQARRVDERVRRGEHLPLAGVPVAIKDLICVKDTCTTAGSRILEHFNAPYNAFVVERLLDAGAVPVCKVNLDEFGMGSSGENSAYGPTQNPHDKSRVPGGSSSGSAAALAAGITPISLGTDTGGSVRLPAAYCGVLGFKPTYGRASRYGLVAYASSLDQVGAMARNSQDLATLLDVICQHDPRDATSLAIAPNFVAALQAQVRGLRVGLVREAMGASNSAGVVAAIERSRDILTQLGATIVDVSLPSLSAALAAYYVVACAEASSNLARYDGMVYGARSAGANLEEVVSRSRGEHFGAEVRKRILLGTYTLSSGYYEAYYSKALKARALIAQDFARAFEDTDVLMLPTAPGAAFKLGAKNLDPMDMYLSDIDTVTVNLAGLPAISVPMGFEDHNEQPSDSNGLPVGVQFVAPTSKDERLLTVSAALEAATNAAFLRVAEEETGHA